MGYFDPTKQSEVLVDASPVGVAAVLTQKSGDEISVISYASRALSSVEQRYSQTEREALAVVFGCEKFHLYLYGSHFIILTDHRPLLGIFNNPRSTPPARIERWVLRLQQYDMMLQYRPGKDNPADFTSRHPGNSASCSRAEIIGEEYINFLAQASTPIALTLDGIRAATAGDKEMQDVIKAIRSDRWSPEISQYQKVRGELSVTADQSLVLRGRRIVLPQSLRQRAIELSHEGHQGLVKSKQLLRAKVWFPNVDKLMADQIEKCIACQSNITTPQTTVPLQMTDLPDYPWQSVSVDFYGELPSGEHLMVLIDDFSRYPVVEIIHSLTATTVIPVLDRVFSQFGTPERLRSDNGPPFNSQDFADFTKYLGIKHHRVTPLWPQANGEVERFMRNLGKVTRAAAVEHKSWKQELFKYLRNYRATPHSTTGVPPATVMFGRDIHIKLPSVDDGKGTPDKINSEIRSRDRAAKARMKSYSDSKRRVKESNLHVGDTVLVRQKKVNKLTPPYSPKPMTVIIVEGTKVTAKCDGHRITRNASFFKKFRGEKVKGSGTPNKRLVRDLDYDEVDIVDPVAHNDPAPVEIQPAPVRPQRRARRPAYLQDYAV
ncbi:PREDICTED: uncharacterized protein K02A2.6-like [Priapulus caudatus]|uniref:RNA-directed DNA polymerase n=1 Tax=Priapulus caudatus TaxID=37621 RepID=A0ABM1E5C4_PRICU|nr:PREDICTED: uncharacterized protein K02A2.6-like [Priapulus caudatus]